MTLEIILVGILIVLLVALFVISGMKKKKFNAEMGQMREDLKVGDKVMTDSGIVGEVVESFVEEEYKYFVLKSGKGDNTGFFTVHGNAIYYVFGKEQANAEKKVVVVAPKKETKPEDENK
ncbi:MAG: preprotein translocase subunit YajC [Clostridia bacterium]|nr:preprotein translocase subunit YajC [Clostridia bacterium]